MRVALVGDAHGDLRFIERAARHAAATDADVAALGDRPIDILITHDTIAAVPAAELSPVKASFVDDLICAENRDRLQQAADNTGAQLVVHGHWHRRYSYLTGTGVHVEGLGHNYGPFADAVASLELQNGTFSMPPGPPLA